MAARIKEKLQSFTSWVKLTFDLAKIIKLVLAFFLVSGSGITAYLGYDSVSQKIESIGSRIETVETLIKPDKPKERIIIRERKIIEKSPSLDVEKRLENLEEKYRRAH